MQQKLYELGIHKLHHDEIISTLIEEDYLNEERFAKAFAGGKFRMKKWGRIKIVHELEAHGISKNCIKIALNEISEEEHLGILCRERS